MTAANAENIRVSHMKFRKLQIAWSVGCGIAGVLIILLWVRSYWWLDMVDVSNWYEIDSFYGQILIFNYDSSISMGAPWSYFSFENLPEGGRATDTTLGFKTAVTPAGKSILFPDWFPILLLAFLGFAPWSRHWNSRFSLRTLLIATTLVAMVLGLAVWALRK
jgi:hypothetical protein